MELVPDHAGCIMLCATSFLQGPDTVAALLLRIATGSMMVNNEELQQRDAAKIQSANDRSTQVKLQATGNGAHFLLIEMVKSSDAP